MFCSQLVPTTTEIRGTVRFYLFASSTGTETIAIQLVLTVDSNNGRTDSKTYIGMKEPSSSSAFHFLLVSETKKIVHYTDTTVILRVTYTPADSTAFLLDAINHSTSSFSSVIFLLSSNRGMKKKFDYFGYYQSLSFERYHQPKFLESWLRP